MTGRLLLAVALVLTTALAMAWGSGGPAQATTFNPFFGPPDFYRLDPPNSSAHADVHAQFNIPPPSANFSAHLGGLLTFEDSDVVIAGSADIPGTGAYMGRLETVATLGLSNEGCNADTPITFDLIEAEVSMMARPFTGPSGNVTVGVGGIPAAADDADNTFTYLSTGGIDPLGIKQGATNTAGTGIAVPGPTDEGNRLVAVNEIRVDGEEMLVTGVDETTVGGGTWRVIRGWNGTTPAAHAAGAQVTRVTVIYPNGPGTNLLANLGEDDGDADNNGVAEEVVGTPGGASFNGNQVADGADEVPSFVRNSLDPNSNADDGGYVQAHARYVGVAFVANSLLVILQFVIMSPGALRPFPNLDWATIAWGYGSITFLQDPLAPPSDSAVTDFCNFKSNTLLYGVTHDNACTGASPPVACTGNGADFTLRLAVDGGCPGLTMPNECGSVRLTLPSTAQALRVYEYAVSQRDYDDDGIENGMDPCYATPNPNWDPRANNAVSGGDSDADGLPDACDPQPGVPNPDQDCDGDPNPAPPCNSTGWDNRHDNCPTTSNVNPVMAEPNAAQFDQDNPAGVDVPDGGPPSDDIGPECDIAANNCGGCVGSLTPTGANGHYHAAFATETLCVGGGGSEAAMCNGTPGLAGGASDPDNDGWVNTNDTCVGIPVSGFEPMGPNPSTQFTTNGNGRTTTTANAGAGATSIIVGNTSGFTPGSPILIGALGSGAETIRYIASGGVAATTITFSPGLTAAHNSGTAVAQVQFAQANPDFNADGFSDISDLSELQNAFGAQGGNPDQDGVGDNAPPGYQGRLDMTFDRFTDISDVSYLGNMFGARCGPP
jgi:hypothetical protein